MPAPPWKTGSADASMPQWRLRQLTLRSYSMTDSPHLDSARRVSASVYAIQLKLSASAQ
jgi:hypothetical protein